MRYLSIIFFSLMLVCSCHCNGKGSGDDNKDTSDQSVNDEKSISNDQNDNKLAEQEEEKLDPQFEKFLDKFEKKSLPYHENPTGKEEFVKISLDAQVKYLSKAEKLSKKDLEDMADYTDFYYISNPLNTKVFHAIVYGRFEMGSTYYFLCTYDNNGKLISSIDFAAYELMGAGPQAGQEFNTEGTIQENMQVSVKSAEETRKYKIQDDGKIVRL